MSQLGFPKRSRLLTAKDFKRVFDDVNAKASNRTLLLLASQNHQGSPRIGFVIAKKQVRTAVQRNRIKRIIREAFRRQQTHLPSVDIIVLARGGLDQLSNSELTDSFLYLCRKLSKNLDKAQR